MVKRACSLPTLWRCSDLDWHVLCQLCGDALTWTDMFPANFVEMLWPGLTCSLPTLWRCSDLDWHVPCQLCGDAMTWTDRFPANFMEMLWPGLLLPYIVSSSTFWRLLAFKSKYSCCSPLTLHDWLTCSFTIGRAVVQKACSLSAFWVCSDLDWLMCSLPKLWRCSDLDWHFSFSNEESDRDVFSANFVEMLWPGLTGSLPTLWRCSDLDWHVPSQWGEYTESYTDMFPASFWSKPRLNTLDFDYGNVDNFDCDWTTFYARAMNGFDCGWTAFLPMAEAVDGFDCDWATFPAMAKAVNGFDCDWTTFYTRAMNGFDCDWTIFPAMAKAVNGFVTEPLSIQELWIALTETEPHSHQWQRL